MVPSTISPSFTPVINQCMKDPADIRAAQNHIKITSLLSLPLKFVYYVFLLLKKIPQNLGDPTGLHQRPLITPRTTERVNKSLSHQWVLQTSSQRCRTKPEQKSSFSQTDV